MQFYVDIDQTISTGFRGKNLREAIVYYRQLGITVPDTIERYPDLFQLPEVLTRHEEIPGSVSGVTRLAEIGAVTYATVRKETVETSSPGTVQQITRRWLHEHGFPNAHNVLFNESIGQKLEAIARHVPTGPMVLIDDRWRTVLNLWPRLQELAPELAERLRRSLILVAFGATPEETQVSSPIPLVVLPSWSDLSLALAIHHIQLFVRAG